MMQYRPWIVVFTLLVSLPALGAAPVTKEAPDGPPPPAAAKRMREGARLVNVTGIFQATGDRITFHSPDLPPLKVLENLALERIAQTLSERSQTREWVVSGTVSEYRGANYLLLSRVAIKTLRDE